MSQEKISVICKGDVIVSADHLALLYQQRAELLEALKNLDDSYCRAGTGLNAKERAEDRKRLIAARAIVSRVEESND